MSQTAEIVIEESKDGSGWHIRDYGLKLTTSLKMKILKNLKELMALLESLGSD